jgi:hypothetical protein
VIEKYAKKLFLGDDEIESALQRLDKLTQEELLAAVAQSLTTMEGAHRSSVHGYLLGKQEPIW